MHLKASILPATPCPDTPTQKQINTDRWGWEPMSFSLGRTQQHLWQTQQKVTLATTGSHLAPGFPCLFFTALPCAHPLPYTPLLIHLRSAWQRGRAGGHWSPPTAPSISTYMLGTSAFLKLFLDGRVSEEPGELSWGEEKSHQASESKWWKKPRDY